MTDSMSTVKHARVFPDLAPPPGGLARLRTKLDGADRRRARLLALAFVPSLAATAAIVALFVTRPGVDDAHRRDVDVAIEMQPALAKPTGTVVSGATSAVPLTKSATLYWVP